MAEDPIQFFEEGVSGFELYTWYEELRKGIRFIVTDKCYNLLGLNVIFLNDEKLKEINWNYLGHDYYTDVITFDLSDQENEVSGEIYLSLSRIQENAQSYGITVGDELLRVVIHGVLHLVGFMDKDEEQTERMRQEENYYLKKVNKD